MHRFLHCCRIRLALSLAAVACSAAIFSSQATVYIITDTVAINKKTAIVRASSIQKAPKTDPKVYSAANMFDNDSTTRWLEGTPEQQEGRWIEIKFAEKVKFKGMIMGAGCRKEYVCLEDYSTPSVMKIKLDEKPVFEYGLEWDVKGGKRQGPSHQEVNMRKAFLWFNTDTAFSSAIIQIKFQETQQGARYDNLSMSDFELIEPSDTRFELLDLLSKRTNNPNDLGAVHSPLLLIGDDSPERLKQVVDSLHDGATDNSWKQDSATIEKGLNTGMRTIDEGPDMSRLIGVLKTLLIKNNNMVRFKIENRVTTYMLKAGTITLGGTDWDIWRYLSTIRTAKGLELTVRYVPLLN
jgi:hypothetical protein